MNEQIKNSKYTVWLYNLTPREFSILQPKFPQEYFEVVDLLQDEYKIKEMSKLPFLNRPDILICDTGTELPIEIRDILCESCCGLAMVSTKPMKTLVGYSFELSDREVEIPVKRYGEFRYERASQAEISYKGIVGLCQTYNFQKLNKIATKKATEIRNTLDIERELNSGKSTETVKKYLSKVAVVLNHYITLKDYYTAGHCERVSKYSKELGCALGLSKDELDDLVLSANLHDIGKVALPDAIITKTSSLNDFEFELMKKHVELGPLILPNELFGSIKSSIRGHHEKYDGSGYPDGLKGDEIPYFAQILAIADSFDAMTSQRSYNKVKSAEEAFEDLIRHTKPKGVDGGLGVHYNPELVKKFIEVISNNKTIMDDLSKQKAIADEKVLQENNSSYQYKKGEGNHE